MKQGFWNYTEPVTYRVVLVELFPVKEPPMHWQNAFAGQKRQAVEISYKGKTPFYIDNGDGSGLLKMEERGGPGSMSRHVSEHNFTIVNYFIPEAGWQRWDPEKCKADEETVATWQKTHFPAEFERVEALRKSWADSPMNPRGKNFKFK